MAAPKLFADLTSTVTKEQNRWHGQTLQGVPWDIYAGNANEVLKELQANTYSCVITSPPYFWLRDYGIDGQIGKEDTVEEYVSAITSTMDEVYRVMKQDGVLFLNIGDTYYSGKGESQGRDKKSNKRRFGLRAVDKSGGLGIDLQRKSIIGVPWRVAIKMMEKKWILRCPIIWHKADCLPESAKDRPSRSYEFVFMFVKDRKYHFERKPLVEGKVDEDVWTIPARPKQANGIDTAPFPDELVKRCIDIGCPEDGSVLDPFAGSGTTLRVALSLKRAATGIELNPDFCVYAVNNLAKL